MDFLLGAVALRITDRILPHIHPGLVVAEGIKTSWHRSTLLVLAITLHNIPEGLAVGVAFGATANLTGAARASQIGAAIALAIGIGLQNFPEGTAVAMPLRRKDNVDLATMGVIVGFAIMMSLDVALG